MRTIRHTKAADLPRILQLIEYGRQKMRAVGNQEQWADGNPREEVLLQDIEQGNSYMVDDDGEAVATFAFIKGPDATYRQIYEGRWLDETDDYWVIHRLASAPSAHGVLKSVLDYCFARTMNIRIDTHRKNVIMRHALQKYGFSYCGIIYLLDGAERLAYQRRVEKITEQPSPYDHLEQMGVGQLLRHINHEDALVAEAVSNAIPQTEALVQAIEPRMKRGGRLFYVGAGTSGRLGVLDASELPPTYGVPEGWVVGLIAGGDKALRRAVENAEDSEEQGWKDLLAYHPTADDTVLGIAASGSTPYVVAAVRQARACGLLTGCITSNPGSSLAVAAEYPIETVVGPEFVTGSSRMKSGTAQKMVLNMISTTLMIRLGRVEGNRMVNMQLANEKLVDRGTRMIQESLHIGYEEARRRLLEAGSVSAVLGKCHL